MDDVSEALAQLINEVQALRRRNAELEAAAVEHQRRLEALHMSEARFRSLVEQFPLSVQIFAPDGRTLQVNHAWETLWGVTLDQIPDYNILHDPQLVTKGIMPYIQRGFGGEAVAIPPILYDPDETLPHRTQHTNPQRWVRAFLYPVNDQTGRLREVVLIHEDITGQHQVEAALRESEARYRTLFANFPNGAVFLFDQDLRYTLASGLGLTAGGMAPDMFEGKTLWEIFPPEIAARDEPALRAALRGEATRSEVMFGARTFVVHTLPVKDEHDVIVGGMVMTQDISERKRAEEHLRLLAEASAILGASLDDAASFQRVARLAVPLLGDMCIIFMVGTDGAIQQVAAVHADGETEGMLHECPSIDPAGRHPAAITIRTGKPVVHAVPCDTGTEGVRQDAIQRGTTDCMIPPAHVIMPLEARGEALGAIAFGRMTSERGYDAGELHLVEEIALRIAQAMEHARLYREAQEALRTRDDFVSIAAHELKTPLATLLGSAELLQRRAATTQPYTLTERDQRILQVIAGQSRRLQQQIDMFLDLSHIQGGRLSLEPRPMDLTSLVGRVVDDLQPTLDRHQVTFSCAEPALIIDGDAVRLEQVLQNLLQNAVKYSPGGGAITLRVGRRGTEAYLAVSDQGIGIPVEAQSQLFERFYRARNAAASGIEGLGIGLAVVVDIVMRHGGRVEVTSVEGEGSTFTVYLPISSQQFEPGSRLGGQ